MKLVSSDEIHFVQYNLINILVTGRNEVVAKVIFLQVSVCPQGEGGGCLPQCMLGCHTPRMENPPPQMENPPSPWDGEPPPGWRAPPHMESPPPGSRHQHTVYERPVRILLECILGFHVSIVQMNKPVLF